MANLGSSKNWLIYSVINPALQRRMKEYASGVLLDIGCGIKPYKSMAAPYVESHIGLDTPDSDHQGTEVDIRATAYDIPCSAESFDTVLCTDVIEHLEEPGRAIGEAYRVLKPSGYAIYTVPLFWHLHEEPRDFFRYTKHGLKYLFEKNGFELVEIKALSGFIVTFSQELVYYLYLFRRGGRINPLWWMIPPIGIAIQSVAWLLNKIDRSHSFTAEYLLVARKP